jgi:hypothetical protein
MRFCSEKVYYMREIKYVYTECITKETSYAETHFSKYLNTANM